MSRGNWERVGRRPAVLGTAMLLAVLLGSCAPSARPPAPAPAPALPPDRMPSPPAEPGRPRLQPGLEPLVDVGIGLELDTLTIGASVPLEVRLGDQPVATLTPGGTLRVRDEEPPSLRWVGGRGSLPMALPKGDTLELVPSDLRAEGARWNGKRWRGALRLFESPRGRLTLVARLPLEPYLLGVVPGEIGALSESLLEAGRAQAIAARSYTLFYLGRRGAEGFDLFATVEDQVYGPIEAERPLATRCVESTAGLGATSGGAPIRANYHASCGGITAEVWEAWPVDPMSYLVSRRDADGGAEYCSPAPNFRWREEWKAEEFIANLARYAPLLGIAVPEAGVGELVDVRVAERSRSGRVWRLEVRTTTGTLVVPAHSLRQALRRGGNPGAILRSNLFKIGVRRDAASGTPQSVVASGAGNGHGAGLCQNGALGMARGGRKGEDILRHYYEGVRIERLY